MPRENGNRLDDAAHDGCGRTFVVQGDIGADIVEILQSFVQPTNVIYRE